MSRSSVVSIVRFFVVIFSITLLQAAVGCSGTPRPAVDSGPPPAGQVGTPESLGMDSALLAEMFQAIQQRGLRLHSLLILRHGDPVVEAYWHPYGPEVKHTIESNTKSVIGALVGIAIEQGSLAGVDQRLVDFFPDREIQDLDGNKRSITLQHLLSMTPGLSCQDLSTAAQGMFAAEDWVQYLLDLPVSDPPGTRWIYCSGAAHLLSAVLQQATGQDARSYANTYLFQPLGIPAVMEEDWGTDPGGLTNGIAGLYLTPRDLARFGMLYLDQGMVEERQILPAAWVEESTRLQAAIGPDTYLGGRERNFGYLWSLFPDLDAYGFLGMAGQELYVVPGKDLVVVFTGALEVGKEAALLDLLADYIIPAASPQASLPPNPQASARLEALIQEGDGSPLPVPDLPQAALEISGRTYLLSPNSLGWEDISLVFTPGSDTAILRMSTSPDLAIGLDNRYRLTPSPDSRPIGLRGRWLETGEFELDYLILGDFIQSRGLFQFDGSRLTLAVTNLNYRYPPLILRGSAAE